MRKQRNISVVLLAISSFIGLVRGYRMTKYPVDNSILFPYTPEAMKDSVFSSYSLFGWILFFLIGVFSIITIICILRKRRGYAYLIVIEGIFMSFFSLMHVLATGLGVIHLIILPLCIVTIVLGVLQTPREF